MDQQNILYMLNYLREQSECIDKQVSCIITDEDDNIASMGWNQIINCDKNCHDKENRICLTEHAEIIALRAIPENWEIEPYKAYVSLFPCKDCQEMLQLHGIKEIISFTEDHKGSSFPNITFAENINYELLNSDPVDTRNKIKHTKYHIQLIESACQELKDDMYTLYDFRYVQAPGLLKSIADMELQLEQLKLILWSEDPEFYNKMREARKLRREILLLYNKPIQGK